MKHREGHDEVLEALIMVLPFIESMDDAGYKKRAIRDLKYKIIKALKTAGVEI